MHPPYSLYSSSDFHDISVCSQIHDLPFEAMKHIYVTVSGRYFLVKLYCFHNFLYFHPLDMKCVTYVVFSTSNNVTSLS